MANNRHSNPDGRWYVPHARVKGRRAAPRARSTAASISDGTAGETPQDVLFEALHSCALRTTKGYHRKAWDARWLTIRNYIVEQNLGLAYLASKPFRGLPLEEDAEAAAMENLIRCVEIFNPWRGFRFSTYAVNGMRRTLWQLKYSRKRRVEDERCSSYEDAWETPAEAPDEGLALRVDALRHALDTNSAELDDRQLYIIQHRHPSGGVRQSTLKEVGDAVGLTKERVRQIQEQALKKLRGALLLSSDLIAC